VTFWRLGQDDDAAEIAREFLKEHPELGQALVILSDIEHRRGNDAEAARLLEQLRRVDADGALAASMAATNRRAARDFLLLNADEMPALDERAGQIINELPQIAPAPDFDYQPPTLDLAGAAGVGVAGAVLGSIDDDVDLDAELAGLTPMTAEEFGHEPDAASFSIDDTSVHPFTLDELDQPEFPQTEDYVTGEQTPGIAAQTVEEDALVDLARALEDDVAVALARAGEPVEAPAVPESAVSPGTGFTTLLSELGDEGHTPFDPARAAQAAQGAGAGYDIDAAVEQTTDELAKLTEGWDELDAEIASAVPVSTGETDELLAIGDLGVAPFSLDEFSTDELSGLVPGADLAPTLSEADPAPAHEPIETGAEVANRVADAPDGAFLSEDEYLEGIEPFSVEDFDDLTGAEFNFGKLPWETNADASALPSDEDLDAMLADVAPTELTPDEQALVERDALTAEMESAEVAEAAPMTLAEATDIPLLETSLPDAPAETLPYDVEGALDELDASLAVTRELGATQDADDAFAARLAAMEAAAALNLEQLQASAVNDEHGAAVPHEPVSATDLFPRADPEQLVSDKRLFERSRAAKDEMVADGVIGGDLELVEQPADVIPEIDETAEPSLVDSQAALSRLPAATMLPPSRSVETLMLSLEVTPDDDELHWWLAEALRERGDARAAMNEYRWLIRHAPHRHAHVTDALQLCVEQQQDPELAHRLLSDAFRRHGDIQKASAHAALAMAERRKLR
jgi:tetratricopeptide (TPR) repeat protein